MYADAHGPTWLEVEGSKCVDLSRERKRSSHAAIVPDVAGVAGVYEVCDGERQACALLTVQD